MRMSRCPRLHYATVCWCAPRHLLAAGPTRSSGADIHLPTADWQDPCDTGEDDLPPATTKVPSTLIAASQHECHHEHGAVSMQYILQAACESLPVIERHGKILIGTNFVTSQIA